MNYFIGVLYRDAGLQEPDELRVVGLCLQVECLEAGLLFERLRLRVPLLHLLIGLRLRLCCLLLRLKRCVLALNTLELAILLNAHACVLG